MRLEEQDLRILKAIATDIQIGLEFVQSYDHNLFFGDARECAKAIISYIKIYKSAPTLRALSEIYEDKPELEAIKDIWDEFSGIDTDVSEYRYDLDKLKQKYTQHETRSLSLLLDDEFKSADDIIRIAEHKLSSIKQVRAGGKRAYTQKTLREFMPEFKEGFAAQARNANVSQGVLTGYSYLDYIKNGMSPAEMLVIGAETSAGKSQLLANLGIQMWLQDSRIDDGYKSANGKNILYFSLEMPYKACARRILSRLAQTPVYAIRDCKINEAQALSLNRVDKFIKEYDSEFEVVDIARGVTIHEIEARYNETKTRFNPDIVIIDYLGLMESDTKDDDWLKLGQIAGQLHEFARINNVIVLTAVQLNRPTKRPKDSSELIGIHRIGRSSLIMHHADIGIQIESRKDEQTYADMKCHIIKNRDGELGEFLLMKDFRCATVKDMDPPYQPPSDDSFTLNDVDDLSPILARIGWYKK